MSPRLPLQVTRRAAREIRAASEWWDENRPAAPDAFRHAIDKAFELIRTQPKMRRILWSWVRYYLYYRVKRKPHAVEVVAIWHMSRYPDLRLS